MRFHCNTTPNDNFVLELPFPDDENGPGVDPLETPSGQLVQKIVRAVNSHAALVEALENLQKQIRAHHKMNVKKDYSLMLADVQASKAIELAKGE